MNKIVVESAIRSRLHDLDTELEFCDESGRVLGYFVPRAEAEHYEWARGQFTEDEIAQARQEPGGRSTKDVLARLQGQ